MEVEVTTVYDAPGLDDDLVNDPLGEIQVIDCDSHFTEPPDLWSSRVPSSLQGRVPEHKTVDGVTTWFLDNQPWASLGGNTLQHGRKKLLGEFSSQPFDTIDRSSYSVKERLQLMDDIGIHTQILYPNGVGFASNHIFSIDDLSLRADVLRTYNDFLADVQDEAGRRLLPQAMLPVWDMDLTLVEIGRMLDRGITGFTLSDKPEMIGLPELLEDYYHPMWDLLNESGAIANFHIGSGARREEAESTRMSLGLPGEKAKAANTSAQQREVGHAWKALGRQRQLTVMATMGFVSNARIVANLCMSDLFDRYPRLRIVSAESGVGWIPFLLQALEYQLDEWQTDPDERPRPQRRPTEYFQDHIYATFWFEHVAPSIAFDIVGVNNILAETDIPHPTCLYPNTVERLRNSLRGLDPNSQRRILQGNAAELYGIVL